MPPSPTRLAAAEELQIAHRIIHLEGALRAVLLAVPRCRKILDEEEHTTQRTRFASVKRLDEAQAMAHLLRADATLLDRADAIAREAQALRWKLACSAVRVAYRESRRMPRGRISVEDLEQEAMLGLFSAAQRFEPDQGVRFAVYARWWVRAQLTRSIQRASSFRISASAVELHRNADKLDAADARSGVVRSDADRAERLGVSVARLNDVLAAGAMRALEDEAGSTSSVLADLTDWQAPTPEDQAAERSQALWLRASLSKSFTEREQHIVTRHHGIDVSSQTLQSVAEGLSLSPERVRQVEAQCVRVLRDQFAREMSV